MNFRVIKGAPPANAGALERVFARFPGEGTVFLEREAGGELLMIERVDEISSERLFMGIAKAWLEKSEMTPLLENAAVRFGVCATAPR